MGEVKRYVPDPGHFYGMREKITGEYVLHSDYARLERERDALAEQLATLQTDVYDAREDERAELTRLRAVEAAALYVLETRQTPRFSSAICKLVEACGRKE